MYLAKALGYYDQYFYITYIITVQNSKIYFIEYSNRGSSAPHFSDITAILNSMTYKQDGVIGYALTTDIIATINNHQIPSYNVNGLTYVVAEDLRYYGFNVYYDNASRTLSITRDYAQTYVSANYTKPYVAPSQVGNIEHSILATDIVTYLNNSYIGSYNINGQTIICFNDLAANGLVSYDNDNRVIALNMYGIN